uniref:Photoreceptor cilium actin regulator n=1 Tax=Crocodylus porosus TaxID=8502 RepID=A0A7M4ERH1_CROPO
MGCTPSRSEIVNHIAKIGGRTLNNPKGVLPVDSGDKEFSIPLLVKNSSYYNTDESSQSGSQTKDGLKENQEKVLERDKNANFHLSSEDHSYHKILKDNKKIKRTEAETALSKMVESQKNVARDTQIKKQSSCESETTACTLDDKNESNSKQMPKKAKKQKSHKQAKQGRHCKTKEKSTPPLCETEEKVDFPELLVKAHQNAYAFLNPNLSKYEAILCMANQATQTQLHLQQMVSFLVLRFNEINQLLEEIANDGEELLKEVGGNLLWPAGKDDPKEHPDLLQQLLQYTVNKMQVVNGTVASLTSDALQETCSYLQSAVSNLELKLKAKQGFDERLLKTIKLLEASAVGPSESHGNDRTLYSEDSGIGADNESVKGFNSRDKLGKEGSCKACVCDHSSQKHIRPPEEYMGDGTSALVTTRSQDYALERHCKAVFYPSVDTKKGILCLESAREDLSISPQCSSLIKSHSLNSFLSDSTQESEHLKNCESVDYPSEDEESTLGEEEDDNVSLSEMGKDALLKRQMSSPAATDTAWRTATKRIENPEKEEIILKMKDAISEKIKFVPAGSESMGWVEDGKAAVTARPSTASGSRRLAVKQRRSRSEESLRSQAEDPTLLELQRTQKELSKRLEIFYALNESKDTDGKWESLKPRAVVYVQDAEPTTLRSSINKLKACLSKNFSVLPNQDKVPLYRAEQNPASEPDQRSSRTPLNAAVFTQDSLNGKDNESPEIQTLSSGSCTPRKSVKKLIETFSPAEGLVKPINLRPLGPIKCIKKYGLPVMPPTLPFQRGLSPLSHKHRVSPIGDANLPSTNATQCNSSADLPPPSASELSTSDTNGDYDVDFENLPPPPPEILMDNSFDLSVSEESIRMEENSSEETKKPAKTEIHMAKRAQISPKMKASLYSFDLLPSKNINRPNVFINKVLRNTGVDPKFEKYALEQNPSNLYSQENTLASQREQEMKEAADLYKQTHKIIPLPYPSGLSKQNRKENPSERKESGINLASEQNPKQSSPDSLRRNEKSAVLLRRASPTQTPPVQPNCSPTHRQPSPPTSPKVSSPPTQKKMSSPPTQRKLSSPPVGRKQSPPTQRKMSSPPANRREASSPPFCATPSPPTSPSWSYKGLKIPSDSGDEQPPPSSKVASNVHSIFCPATSSLFEAKPPSPPSKPTAKITGKTEVSGFAPKNSVLLRPWGDQSRRLAASTVYPQPFVKRSFSDRRPGFQLRLPAPATASSEPALNQPSIFSVCSMGESTRKAGDSWNSSCFSEIKDSSRSSSHPELYIVGQGLQRDSKCDLDEVKSRKHPVKFYLFICRMFQGSHPMVVSEPVKHQCCRWGTAAQKIKQLVPCHMRSLWQS